MARPSPQIAVEEMPGNEFASLDEAQRVALDALASHLAQTIRDLLASGRLVQVDGKIIPNPNR